MAGGEQIGRVGRRRFWSTEWPTREVSMTWPQYQRRQCVVDGALIQLTPLQTELLSTLLMRRGQVVSHGDLIDAVWPDPDHAPDWEYDTLKQQVSLFRRRIKGVIRTEYRRGHSIPLSGQFPLARAA